MPRPDWSGILDLDVPGMPERFSRWVAALRGVYEVRVEPRRATRTLRQNAFFHACRVKPLADYLRDQDEELSPHAAMEIAKGMIKDQFLRTSVIDKTTGEVTGSYVPNTRDLDVVAMADLIDRSGPWLVKKFGLDVPADAERWAGLPAVATAPG